MPSTVSGQTHGSDLPPPPPGLFCAGLCRVSKVPALTLCVWPFTYMISYVLLLILSPIERYTTDEETEAQVTQLPVQLQNTHTFPQPHATALSGISELINCKHQVVWVEAREAWEGLLHVVTSPASRSTALSLSFRCEVRLGMSTSQVLRDSSERKHGRKRTGTHLRLYLRRNEELQFAGYSRTMGPFSRIQFWGVYFSLWKGFCRCG